MDETNAGIQPLGIHHVTGIAGDPQKNLDFYSGLLGLRLVKLTVNFDDPTTYHLYYGDGAGNPGTILTFFPWPGASRGRAGTGQTSAVAFAIRPASLGYWITRLVQHGVPHEGPVRRFGEQVLSFHDPDGLQVELVAHKPAEDWATMPTGMLPNEHEIRGFHSVTLWEEGYEQTAQLLTHQLGFRAAGDENNVFRYVATGGDATSTDATGTPGAPGTIVDVRCAPGFWRGVVAVGTIHHVAFRARNDATQLALREQLARQGLNVTPVIDRQYFHSVYFREPGGVLFEIATDPPGFAIDEPLDELGTHLKLPPWLEGGRTELARVLPPLRRPAPRGPAEGGIEPEAHIEVRNPSI
jgi:catechol 2,3-dioxygenase-like lactoylglutathione lyase family enzyme